MENGLLRFLFWLEDATERFVFFFPSRNSYKTLKFDFSYLLRCSSRVSCFFRFCWCEKTSSHVVCN